MAGLNLSMGAEDDGYKPSAAEASDDFDEPTAAAAAAAAAGKGSARTLLEQSMTDLAEGE